MNITASQVNELRNKTGAGMMDCKKALTEAEGNIEKAIEILRKKGAAVAAKRADKAANEGLVLTKIVGSEQGFIIEVNCETDFVAKSDDFIKFADKILEATELLLPTSFEDLLAKDPSLQISLDELIGKVGEKIVVSRVAVVKADNGILVDYIHPGSKLGVIVRFDFLPKEKAEEFLPLAKDIAMQVAAMKPVSVYSNEVPKDVVEKEIDIYKEIARKEGKPENILEKIATGKLGKFYQENCLAEQAYIKDNSKSIGNLIAEFNNKNGTETKINSFLRFHLGDENKK